MVIMGAMESVNDSTVSWLAHEARLIKNLLNHQVRLFGICFGAQHIAKILGGSVYKMVNPIVRLSDISLNRDGKLHPIFCGFQINLKQSHCTKTIFNCHYPLFLWQKAVELCRHFLMKMSLAFNFTQRLPRGF